MGVHAGDGREATLDALLSGHARWLAQGGTPGPGGPLDGAPAELVALRDTALGAGSVGPVRPALRAERAMDACDVGIPAYRWFSDLVGGSPRSPAEEVTCETADVGVHVWWVDRRPRAVVVAFRDPMNFAYALGVDLARPEGGGDAPPPGDRD